MDKKRLQELGGVVAEATEQEKLLEAAEEQHDCPTCKGSGRLRSDYDGEVEDCTKCDGTGEVSASKIPVNEDTLEEAGMFGRAGYGGEKNQEQQILSELAQMLRDAKVFLRDGNTNDAAMMIDRAYSRVTKFNQG